MLCRVLLSLCIKCSREGGQTLVGAPESDVPRPVARSPPVLASQAKPGECGGASATSTQQGGGVLAPEEAGSQRPPVHGGGQRPTG